jgi:truncated hemoglobin YjbI
MTLEEISLVQNTWAKVVPIKEAAAELFYGKLFELDPALKPLFKGDIMEQGRKLMAMIDVAVNGLARLEHGFPQYKRWGVAMPVRR